MNSIRPAILLLALSLAAPAQASECTSLDDLDWLMGYWESRNDESVTSERWVRVSEETVEITGRNFALPHFEQTFLETIRLAVLSGEIFFIAKVSHNPLPVSFKLTDCSEVLVAFENAAHDFPNRIAYRKTGEEQVNVEVSATGGDGFGYALNRKPLDRRIALTFDDAPRSDSRYLNGKERTQLLIESLTAENTPPVIFFSTTRGIDEAGDSRMRAYQQAGHFIGNHTHSHRRISAMGKEAYADDIRKAHEVLSGYESFVPLFRYPFLDEGRDTESRDYLRDVLKELGYRNGYVTIDNYDFAMDSLLQRATEQGREINRQKLGQAYVSSLMESVRFAEDIASRFLEHSPSHTLLLHENDLAALFIGDLIKALRAEGWTIIDARDAFDDPIAEVIPDTLFNNQGRVSAIAHVAGASPRELVHRAEDTEFLEQYFEDHGAFGEPKAQLPGDSD